MSLDAGPRCIQSCAKENRSLPKPGYTNCLAMDGVKILAFGLEVDEKSKIEEKVIAMGGVFQTSPSMGADFVIMKSVLDSKYKWALNVLKKPIMKLSWVEQCWSEHRLVPQEPYRLLPFTGLNICVTRISLDERKEMEKKIVLNGGLYSADLTKKCTHLVSNAPGGDKYVVARRWGNIHIVNCRWIDHCIARRACLDEGGYSVTANTSNIAKLSQKELQQQQICSDSLKPTFAVSVDDVVSTVSQTAATSFSDTVNNEDEVGHAPTAQMRDEHKLASCVAEDSADEDNDLYLSNCRISLVGYGKEESSNLVTMIRKGGGSRYVMLSEKLTHIIVGDPSEAEKKEIRLLASRGVIDVVKSSWLEECVKAKCEISVLPRHIASELLYPKESPFSGTVPLNDLQEPEALKISFNTKDATVMLSSHEEVQKSLLERKRAREKPVTDSNITGSLGLMLEKSTCSYRNNCFEKEKQKLQFVSLSRDSENKKLFSTFKGRKFCFSSTFPQDTRAEVVGWIREGGGTLVDDQKFRSADYIVERHGTCSSSYTGSNMTLVSTHWIRSCLEEGSLQDVGSHIIYSPLRCQIPLPGFEGHRFCVSQYEGRDRILLKNTCVTLGAKFTEKFNSKVTHLLCKYTNGPKYEASCKKGIVAVTAEWIFACVSQDMVVDVDQFKPKTVYLDNRDASLCSVSQFVTQGAEPPSQTQVPVNSVNSTSGDSNCNLTDQTIISDGSCKRPRRADETINFAENAQGNSTSVPDVADAIEDLLAQSSKIQDIQSPGKPVGEANIYADDHSVVGHDHEDSKPAFGITKHWLNQPNKEYKNPETPGHGAHPCTYDAFSETQTDSQVVGYEEDLSGRQKIIDRVRSQSISLTPINELPSNS